MWPSTGGSTSTTTTNINSNNNNINNKNNDFTASPPSRSSSSTCSSPSPNESSCNRKSMEEEWNDINMSSLVQDQPQLTTHKNINPFTLQDFLARSFNSNSNSKDPTTTTAPTGPSNLNPFDSLAGTLTPWTPLPPHPPATILSLNSPGSDHPIISRPQLLQSHFNVGAPSFGSSSLSSDFDPYGSPLVFPSSFKKRAPENGEESGDRRCKRMIKNRESAARSRARKQAYTNELEHEVNRLLEENAKLKRQQETFLAAAARLPKKRTLCRTLTAPF